MFCEFRPFSKFKDVERLKATLQIPSNVTWLKECHVCVSGCGTMAACASRRRLVVLRTQWEPSTSSGAFVEAWSGDVQSDIGALHALHDGESICIVVGHDNGDVAFYSEHEGRALLTERFDASPVVALKSDADELHAVYRESVCCVPLPALARTLKRARLRQHADAAQLRKLGFATRDVQDAAVVGLEIANTFDHLLTASVHGGFYTGYRSVAPHNTSVICVGARPYVGFHQALEGGNAQPLLNDVARAVASKIKSALPGWLGGAKAQEDTTNVVPPQADAMMCRYSLCDLHRKGLAVITSPDRRLCAVTDTFGRVVLLDVRRGTAVRIFKGYRNSQCAFMQINEETKRSKGKSRKVLFIVLYVAKHGLLEIWPLRGPRVAAFSVSQNARIFSYAPNVRQQTKKRSNTAVDSQLLILDADGNIKSISVPFHFALNSEDSDRSKDVHLVKKLRQLVKEKDCNEDKIKAEVFDATKEIKTPEIRIHCIEMMIGNKNIPPQLLFACVDLLRVEPTEESVNNSDIKKLNVMCDNLNALLIFFMCSNSIEFDFECQTDETEQQNDNDSDVQSKTPNCVIITDTDLINLQRLLSYALSVEQKRNHNFKVTFTDAKKSVCTDFISCFNLLIDSKELVLKDNLSEETLIFLSKQIFNSYIVGDLEWIDVQNKINKTIAPSVLCKLLLVYWMNLSVQDINKNRMEKFTKTMFEICYSEDIGRVYLGYGETSPWWQAVRDFLVESSCPFRSMVCAQLCRDIARRIEKEQSKQSDFDESVWESVSRDNAQWGLLIGKLDDIALLSIILSQKLESQHKLPILPVDLPEINLKYVFHRGRGSISELVGIWLCTAGISLNDIEDLDKELADGESEETQESKLLSVELNMEENNSSQVKMAFSDKMYLLRKQFPFSLNSDNLISNMCWEYIKCWSVNIEDLTYFEASLKCLKSISNMHLRCGMCSMMWSTYLLYPFESASKLIGKVGKLPREKLTRQNVGLSDGQLLKFLEIVTEFLDLFLCGNLSSKEGESKVLKFEDLWDDSKPALTELAMMKSEIQVDILQVHYQLCAALYYQCFLGSNYWKHASNLFDVESQKSMFGSLNNATGLHHQSTDSRVMIQRALFLSRLVNKCVELAKDKELWIERIQDLARLWRVNDDHVRRENVTSLYAIGLDTEAEEALASVTDVKSLLELLIPIAGRRLKHFIDSAENKANVIAVLNPHVTTYLQSLEEVANELVNVQSLAATRRLIEIVLSHENQKRVNTNMHKIAMMLLEACIIIQEDLKLGL